MFSCGRRRSGRADSATADIRDVFDLNVIAACVCTREAVRQMRDRDASGHVVIINRYVSGGCGWCSPAKVRTCTGM